MGLPDGAMMEEELFGDLIGCNDIKQQLSRIRSTFVHAEKLGLDPCKVRPVRLILWMKVTATASSNVTLTFNP